MDRRERLVWMAAACVPILGRLLLSGGLLLGEDAYQYLSGAENFSNGRGVATSLLHYDVERASGRIPAPLTARPPGYSLSIAALHAVGVPFEAAGGVISALGFVALIPILAAAARVTGVSPLALRVAFLWLLFNSWSWLFPAAATTESLFTALTTGAVALALVASRREESAAIRPLLIASFLLGVAYWVRYAGLLFLAGFAIYYGARLLLRPGRMRFAQLLSACGPAAVLVLASAVRNLVLVGSWHSGYYRGHETTVAALAKQTPAAIFHLVFGDAGARFGLSEAILGVAVVALIAIAIQSAASEAGRQSWPALSDVTVLGIILGTYVAGLIAIAATSPITFDSRMFYPLLPLAFLALAMAASWIETTARSWRRRAALACLVAATAGYVAINARGVIMPRTRGEHLVVTQRLDGPLRAWIDQSIPLREPIAATDGQATGYALHRPVISFTPAKFTMTRWTEETVRQVMDAFGARFLLVYTDATQDPVQSESAFLSRLTQRDPPSWLELAADNSAALVFRVR